MFLSYIVISVSIENALPKIRLRNLVRVCVLLPIDMCMLQIYHTEQSIQIDDCFVCMCGARARVCVCVCLSVCACVCDVFVCVSVCV